MAKPGVKKIRPKFPVPQSLDEAASLISVIGEKRRRALQIAKEADERMKKIQQATDKKLAPLLNDLDLAFTSIKSYADSHRDEITDGRKTKTVETSMGKMFWKDTPPRVEIPEDKEQEVLDYMESLSDLSHFVRHPPTEIDRQALLADVATAETIPNVKIVQEEKFGVKPKDDKAELTQSTIDKLLKKTG